MNQDSGRVARRSVLCAATQGGIPRAPSPRRAGGVCYTGARVVSLVSTVRDIDRLRQIILVLGRHGFGEVVQRTGLGRLVRRGEGGPASGEAELLDEKPQPIRRIGMGERLRLVLQDLGPSFVKLGQILSTRSDLIPPDIIAELKKLQDRVPPVDFAELEEQLEAELGAPLDQVFAELTRTPLASASIAQVHRAKLRLPSGELTEVVLKIQRPGIKNTIERDMELLYLLARAIEKSIPEARIYSPVGLVTEFDRAITAELDFTREADNAGRFLRAFAEEPTARFPAVYQQVSGKRVLTLEFLPGLKLHDALAQGHSGEKIAKIALHIIFRQVFEDGFFHADPHPGNLMILGDPEAPVLGMIDLGLVGRLSPRLRDKTVDMMVAAVRQDSIGVADALYAIGTPTRRIDRAKYDAEVSFLAERYLGKPLKEIEVSALIRDIVYGAVKYGLEIPPEFVMLGRTLMTIEGVGKEIYPDLDVFSELQPFFIDLVRQRYSPERLSNDLLRTMSRFGETAGHMPAKVDEILDDLRRGTLLVNARDPEMPKASDLLGRRIFSGLTVASLIGGGSLLVASGAGQLPGYVMLGGAGVWLVGHAARAGLASRKIGRDR